MNWHVVLWWIGQTGWFLFGYLGGLIFRWWLMNRR